MGGTSTQSSTSNTKSTTDPYAPTIQPLQNLVGQISSNTGSAAANPTEQSALSGLMANAQSGNPYAGQIGSLATNLLNGGTDRTGIAQDAYNQYQSSMQPYANMDTNPYTNPAFANLVSTLTADTTNQIKSQYAGAGYSPVGTGDYSQTLGRGISQGVAPTFLNAYNDLSNQKLGAINGLYNAGNTTTGVLSGLDQTKLGNQQAGVGAATNALNARDSAYNQQLAVSGLQRNLPYQNIGSAESLLLPIAQLGGSTTGTGTTTGSNTMSGAQQFATIGQGVGGFGKLLWG